MRWSILLLLAGSPAARAETPHLPTEMKQKISEAGAAMAEGVRHVKRKVAHAEEKSSTFRGAVEDLEALWGKLKRKGRSAVLYLDRQLHERVIGKEDGAK
jgi:hypothetical protein